MDENERRLLTRLAALNVARYAALATIVTDDELEECEQKASMANQLYTEIEQVEGELERLGA